MDPNLKEYYEFFKSALPELNRDFFHNLTIGHNDKSFTLNERTVGFTFQLTGNGELDVWADGTRAEWQLGTCSSNPYVSDEGYEWKWKNVLAKDVDAAFSMLADVASLCSDNYR